MECDLHLTWNKKRAGRLLLDWFVQNLLNASKMQLRVNLRTRIIVIIAAMLTCLLSGEYLLSSKRDKSN